MLRFHDWLKLSIDPFTDRVGQAGAIGADGSGRYWQLVQLCQEVKISVWVIQCMFNFILDVVGGVITKIRTVFTRPLKYSVVEVVGCNLGLFVGNVRVRGGIIKMLQPPLYIFVAGDSNWTKSLVGREDNNVVVGSKVFKNLLLNTHEIRCCSTTNKHLL